MDRNFARSKRGWTDAQIDLVAEKFLLHHQIKTIEIGAISKRWRLWVLKEREMPEDRRPDPKDTII